jgi:ankyrin repeat protein
MLKHKWLTCFVLLILLFVIQGCKNKNEAQKQVVKSAPAAVDAFEQVPNVSMHEAALNGQLEMVKDLLGKGLNVNLKDQDGRTPLMYASFNGHVEIIQLLIDKGAQVNVFDSYGRTPLMMASSGPYPEAVKFLLDHNADPNVADKEEHFTALMFAAAEGQLDVVKILLSNKANPFLKDIDGDDAMTFAANNGHKEVAALLQSLK